MDGVITDPTDGDIEEGFTMDYIHKVLFITDLAMFIIDQDQGLTLLRLELQVEDHLPIS